ncbi:MAG: phospholipid carrier-dependent glycosyltransferase [Candidatus Zapsychrus exili]|nr:phospholipid carrier-dependent glycosyltransferase [Candidatus Zapsychrus exili]
MKLFKNLPLHKKTFLHTVAIVIICLWVSWYFFKGVGNSSYPWYFRFGNDIDSVFAVESASLINDGDPATHVFYPAITHYNIYGFAMKVAATVNSDYKQLLHLKDATSIRDVLNIVERATYICRMGAFFIAILFSILMYGVFYRLTKSKLFGFMWTFILITSERVIYHVSVVRPETLSLLFFFIAFYFTFSFLQKNKLSVLKYFRFFIFSGCFFGLSIFSKVQIAPAIFFYILFMFYYLFSSNDIKSDSERSTKSLFPCLFVSILNILIFPWWSVRRPDHVDYAYIPKMSRYIYSWLYGPAPLRDSFITIPLTILISLLVASVVFFVLCKIKKSGLVAKLYSLVLFINLLILGGIVSIYLVCIPAAASFKGYLNNTQNFVYATFSNFYFTGIMKNKVLALNNFIEIYKELKSVPVFIFNLFIVELVVLMVSMWRLLVKKTKEKKRYLFSLFLLFVGLCFSFASSMRYTEIHHWYSIYAICFYILSAAHLLFTELNGANFMQGQKVKTWFKVIVLSLFCLHIVGVAVRFIKLDKHIIGTQRYLEEYNHCRWLSYPFWQQADRNIYYSKENEAICKKGRAGVFGANTDEVIAVISKEQDNAKLITDEGRIGEINKFAISYITNFKARSYFYNYFISLGDLYINSGDLNSAFASYNKAVVLFPYLPEVYIKMANLFAMANRYEETLSNVKSAKMYGAKIDPKLLKQIKDKIDR